MVSEPQVGNNGPLWAKKKQLTEVVFHSAQQKSLPPIPSAASEVLPPNSSATVEAFPASGPTSQHLDHFLLNFTSHPLIFAG